MAPYKMENVSDTANIIYAKQFPRNTGYRPTMNVNKEGVKPAYWI